MKIIKYNLIEKINIGTEEEPIIEKTKGAGVEITCTEDVLESNLELARREAFEEPIVEDDGVEKIPIPTQLDRIEAQITYTAMMTDTLLED